MELDINSQAYEDTEVVFLGCNEKIEEDLLYMNSQQSQIFSIEDIKRIINKHSKDIPSSSPINYNEKNSYIKNTFGQFKNKRRNLRVKNLRDYKYESRDVRGRTPLHKAVLDQDVEKVKDLVSKGANINTRDCCGNTPLHSMFGIKNYEIKEFLLERENIELNPQNDMGQTPLMLAVINALDDRVELLLLNTEWESLYDIRDFQGKDCMDYLLDLKLNNTYSDNEAMLKVFEEMGYDNTEVNNIIQLKNNIRLEKRKIRRIIKNDNDLQMQNNEARKFLADFVVDRDNTDFQLIFKVLQSLDINSFKVKCIIRYKQQIVEMDKKVQCCMKNKSVVESVILNESNAIKRIRDNIRQRIKSYTYYPY